MAIEKVGGMGARSLRTDMENAETAQMLLESAALIDLVTIILDSAGKTREKVDLPAGFTCHFIRAQYAAGGKNSDSVAGN